jgi:hypothetical protein
MSGEGSETASAPWYRVAKIAEALVLLPVAVAYDALGGATALGRGLRGAVGSVLSPAKAVRQHEPRAAVRHTLRVVADDSDGAAPFSHQGGATHTIRYNPNTPHARSSLAHEFAHVLLAVVRGGATGTVDLVEECAAWALARAVTRGEIWTREALAYRERRLAEQGVPAWASAPRMPPPTQALVRWLAQSSRGASRSIRRLPSPRPR